MERRFGSSDEIARHITSHDARAHHVCARLSQIRNVQNSTTFGTGPAAATARRCGQLPAPYSTPPRSSCTTVATNEKSSARGENGGGIASRSGAALQIQLGLGSQQQAIIPARSIPCSHRSTPAAAARLQPTWARSTASSSSANLRVMS